MKELSIEEKAKRYDEAIERAKVYKGLQAEMEFIFPELKESEDEQIRKELLNAFQESEDSLYMVLTPHKRESFIAWLEKQGKPTDILDDAVLDSNKDGLIADTIRHKKELVTCPICGSKIEKQGEQKSNFKIGDIIKRPNSKVTYKVTNIDDCGFQLDGGHWFKLDRKSEFELVEYKSAFWSKEDERTYKSIIYSFANNYPLTVQQQEFVKSLRPQKLKD